MWKSKGPITVVVNKLDEQIVLEATIEDIIFQNKENGYTVCTVEY